MIRARCTSLVGRRTERDSIEDAIDSAAGGYGGTFLITGEAGIGKSKISDWAIGRAREAGLTTACGRARPNRTGTPYLPLTEVSMGLLRTHALPRDDELGPWLRPLRAIVPLLGSGPVDPVPAVVAGEAFLRLVEHLSPGPGALVVIEDLHWADADTTAVVEYLAAAVATRPFLLVLTHRSPEDDDDSTLLRRLRTVATVTHLTLEPLDDQQVEEVARECRPDIGPAEIQRAQRCAAGVPLYVEELLSTPGIPRSLRDSVHARVDRLDTHERRVLAVAAILGTAFDWHLLPSASGEEASVVDSALERAADALLLDSGPDGYRFHHPLVRDAVLALLGPSTRAKLARAALDGLTRADPDLHQRARDLVVDLADQAGDRRIAGTLLAHSGEAALERGAVATAAEALRLAADRLSEEDDLARVESSLVEALALAGRVDEAVEVGNSLIGRVRRGRGSPEWISEVHLRLAQAAVAATRWTVAETHLLAAEQAGERPGTDALRPSIDVLRGELSLASGDSRAAKRLATSALAAPLASPEVQCQAFEIVGRCERLTDTQQARRTFERGLLLAEAHHLPVWRLRALHELGTIELLEEAGTTRLLRAREIAVALGVPSVVAVVDLQLAAASDSRFDPASAEIHARSARELAEALGLDDVRSKAIFFLAETAALRLRRDDMEELLEEVRADSRGDEVSEGFAWGTRATLELLDGRWGSATDAFLTSIDILARTPHAEPANFRGLGPLFLVATGHPSGPTTLHQARRLKVDRGFANRGFLLYADAVVVGREGRQVEATSLAASADRALAPFGLWRDLARLSVAERAETDGWGRPGRWRAEAAPRLRRHGLDRLEARCSPQGAANVGWDPSRFGLTPREREVLGLVAAGMANKEIATALGLSPRTVEKHVESLLRKTSTRSRTQLAVLAGTVSSGSSGR